MSFGGVVSAMVTSLKNNKRSRPSAFEKLEKNGIEYSSKTELHFDKNATKHQLKKIREKIKKENHVRFRNKIIIIAGFVIILIYIIGFVKL